MTITLILYIAAIILFILSAVGVTTRVNLLALGLACLAGGHIAG